MCDAVKAEVEESIQSLKDLIADAAGIDADFEAQITAKNAESENLKQMVDAQHEIYTALRSEFTQLDKEVNEQEKKIHDMHADISNAEQNIKDAKEDDEEWKSVLKVWEELKGKPAEE